MNFDYDENLSANPFYKALQSQHEILLQAAAQENWVICVPRAAYFDRDTQFSTDFVLRHILVENNDLASHYTNLHGHNVILDGRQVVLVASRTQQQLKIKSSSTTTTTIKRSASILFEEIVYRTDPHLGLSKFKLWCLDRPIISASGEEATTDEDGAAMAEPIQYFRIETFEEAHKFLDSEFVKSKFVLQRVQKICQEFIAGVPGRNLGTVELLHNTTKLLLNRVWNVLLSSNHYVKKLARDDTNYARMLKMAVENYAGHFVHKFLLDQIAILEAGQCEQLNRKIVNLYAARREEAEKRELIQQVADKLLEMETQSTTVYEQLKVFREILKGISTRSGAGGVASSDEVLEVLVEAVIQGRSLNWHPNLVLLKRFQFTEGDNDSSELSYLVTTLEATIQCILQERLLNEGVDVVSKDSSLEIPSFHSKREFLTFLLYSIKARDEETVLELINLLTSPEALRQKVVARELCHPLCDCANCQRKILAETPTMASTVDEATGDTCVHQVAKYGLVNAMRRILAVAAEQEEMVKRRKSGTVELPLHRLKNLRGETPLHVAGRCGQQNILLLLLHHDQGMTLNLVEMRGNSVLHLAARLGHLSCVKALLYFAEHKQLRVLQVNGKNYAGDTALHLAARSGFKGIVETLLEFTASKAAKNNLGRTPADVAFSTAIRELIKDDSWDRVAVNHKLKGLEQRLEGREVELVVKSIERGDVNLALSLMRIKGRGEEEEEGGESGGEGMSRDLDIIGDLDAEDRVNSCTAEGVYPIHVAMRCNNVALVRVLVRYNVDFDVRTRERQETPFHWAVSRREGVVVEVEEEENDWAAIKYVFDNVPNLDSILNEQNVDGDTVLHVAVRERQVRLIQMLLKFNVDFGLTNGGGWEVIGLAREVGLNDMADYMEYVRFRSERSKGGEVEEEGAGTLAAESSSTSSQSR